jgi:hypothetical protein
VTTSECRVLYVFVPYFFDNFILFLILEERYLNGRREASKHERKHQDILYDSTPSLGQKHNLADTTSKMRPGPVDIR